MAATHAQRTCNHRHDGLPTTHSTLSQSKRISEDESMAPIGQNGNFSQTGKRTRAVFCCKLTLGDPWQDSASFSLARNKACPSCATCSQFGTKSRLATLLISTVVQGVYTGVAAPPFPIAYEAVLQPCWSRHVTTATAVGYLPT